jgi:hypothetical protein
MVKKDTSAFRSTSATTTDSLDEQDHISGFSLAKTAVPRQPLLEKDRDSSRCGLWDQRERHLTRGNSQSKVKDIR